jgi:hypothetical protein
MNGNVAKLHLALTALPDFTGLAEDAIAGRLVIAPSVRTMSSAPSTRRNMASSRPSR